MCAVLAKEPISQTIKVELRSPDWRLRRVAFSKIRSNRSLEATRALVKLLGREEDVTLQAYREGIGAEYKFGEEYPEYTAQLTDVVQENFTRVPDPDALKVLMYASYNPDSIFARWLGMQGAAVLPFTVDMLKSDTFPTRESAIAVVTHVLLADEERRVRLSSADAENARRQLIIATQHPDMSTRAAAVEYIGRVGRETDVEWLLHLSTSDPGRDDASSKFIVREAAVKAIAEIKSRAQAH